MLLGRKNPFGGQVAILDVFGRYSCGVREGGRSEGSYTCRRQSALHDLSTYCLRAHSGGRRLFETRRAATEAYMFGCKEVDLEHTTGGRRQTLQTMR